MKLDFDDDTADRRALEQQHDEIGAIFGGLHLGEVSRLDPCLRVRRQIHVQSTLQQLRRECGPVAEQKDQRFVQLRRHAR